MRMVTKGATDQSVSLYIVDATTGLPATGLAYNSIGIDLWYRRPGAAKTSITEVTLAALTTAHADGGFLEIGNGLYRLDLPDAAVATGVDHVLVGGTITGYVVYPMTVQLAAFDLQTATPAVDLSAAERQKLTGYAAVSYIATTDDAKAIIEGSSAGTLCLLSRGVHTEADPVTIPDGVTVRGAGVDATQYVSSTASPLFITPGDRSCLEDLTITAEVGIAVGATGTTQVVDAVLRRVKTTAASIVGVQLSSSNACSLSIHDSQITGQLDGVLANSVAHVVDVFGTNVRCTSNGADGVFAAGMAKIRMYGGSVAMDGTSAVKAVHADGTGRVEAFGVDIDGPVSADVGTAVIRLVDCEANRALFSGSTITDILSPLQPLVANRKLGVESDGDLTKVNLAAAIDAGGITTGSFAAGAINAAAIGTGAITNAKFAANAIDATAIAANAITDAKVASDVTIASVTGSVGSVVGHTPQTGDSFARIGANGSGLTSLATAAAVANVDSDIGAVVTIVDGLITDVAGVAADVAAVNALVLDVPTVAEFTARTLTAAAYGTAGAQSAILADVGVAVTQSTTAATQATSANVVVSSGTHGNAALKTAVDAKASQVSVDSIKTDTGTTLPAAIDGIEGGGGTSQPRINKPPAERFTFEINSRSDGGYKARGTLRLTPNEVANGKIAFGVKMDELYGDVLVREVGTPVVSTGLGGMTVEALGPHDTIAMGRLGGTVNGGETGTITMPVTMDVGEGGETIDVTLAVEILQP